MKPGDISELIRERMPNACAVVSPDGRTICVKLAGHEEWGEPHAWEFAAKPHAEQIEILRNACEQALLLERRGRTRRQARCARC